MKKLKDCYDEIYKCSKCGLCQAVCPVFKITKNEAVLSRGKFLMLLNYLDGKLSLSPTMRKYLDICTSCGACSKFCPSGIDANKIFNLAKFEFKRFSFEKIFNIMRAIFLLPEKVFNFLYKRNVSATNDLSSNKINVIYFDGCFTKFINSSSKKATLNILKKLGVNVIQPEFSCCGIVAQNLGDKKMFECNAKSNIDILKKYNADFIIFDCASCLEVVKSYDKYFEIENFDEIKNKCISVLEFLQIKNIKFQSHKLQKITYHKPCHLDYDVEALLSQIENTDYIRMNDFDKCCGFAGEFAIKNSKIASQMLKDKAKNIENTPCNIVLTHCPSCVLGLNCSKMYTKKKFKVINIIEFLDKLKIIA